MNTALIWDLDGTLIDSYPVIVKSLLALCDEVGFCCTHTEIEYLVKSKSVSAFLVLLSQECGFDCAALKKRYSAISRQNDNQISLLPHAAEVLAKLSVRGASHFIYTHRGASSLPIMERLGIGGYFRELVTSENGFPRKPDPAALFYLMEKYNFSPATSYYIGDRDLDIVCGKHANLQTVLLAGIHTTAQADVIIDGLDELLRLF